MLNYITYLIALASGVFLIYLLFRLSEKYASMQVVGFTGYLSLSEVSRSTGNLSKIVFSRAIIYIIVFILQLGTLTSIFGENFQNSLCGLVLLMCTTMLSWIQSNLSLFILEWRKLKYFILHFFALTIPAFCAFLIFLLNRFTPIPELITPSPEGIRDNLWSSLFTALIIIGYFKTFQPSENSSLNTREVDIIRTELKQIVENHKESFIKLLPFFSKEKKDLFFSIIIYESLNRPYLFRKMENLYVRITHHTATLGIAQTKSQIPISDEESIEILAHQIINYDLNHQEFPDDFLRTYNDHKEYKKEIINIMKIINEVEIIP